MHIHSKTLIGVAAALALSACGQKPAAPGAPPPAQVTVAVPLQEQVTDWEEFTGRFEAVQRVEVRARAGGFIQSAHFAEGESVRKGQLLFTLDPRPAQAALASAQADAQLARQTFERGEALMKDQAISREEFDKRKAALDVADAQVQARKLDVEFTRVSAPASGVVSDRRVDPGNVISGGTSTADVLTTIVGMDPIHFEFEASEAQLLAYQRQASKGDGRVEIQLQDENDYRWHGVVDFADAEVDAASGAVRMRAKVANPDGFLKPGMFGRARVEGSAAYSAMLIPETAIVSSGSVKTALVVGADGIVQSKTLETGPLTDGLRVVRSGLAANDQVIVNGVQRALPGAVVAAKATTITRTAELADPARRNE
jgi:RND family efflux transporter MFP subunit